MAARLSGRLSASCIRACMHVSSEKKKKRKKDSYDSIFSPCPLYRERNNKRPNTDP